MVSADGDRFELRRLHTAQLVVVDPASIAQSAANELIDLAKYIEMVDNQVAQLNNMAQRLQVQTALNRSFGDPSS